MSERKEILCESVGCNLPGFREERREDGERLLRLQLKHDGALHIKKVPLAEKTVRLIKQDKDFAMYFQKLLNA